jgi:hypothetical protein
MSQHMTETVEVTIDDAEKFMVTEMTDDDVELDEFISDLIGQTIYTTYKQSQSAQQPDEA